MKKIFMIFLLCTAVIMGGCIEKNTQKLAEEESTPVISFGKIPDSILDSDGDSGDEVMCALFDGLVRCSSDGSIEGDLAKEYSVSDDGISYTFKLRDDICWSSGKKITSYDFVDFFKKILSPDSGIKDLKELYGIFGAKSYNEGKGKFSGVAIDAPDKETLKIRMNYRDDNLLLALSKPKYRLRKEFELLKNYKKDYENIDYTGAYKIKSIDDSGKIELEKNDKYYEEIKCGNINVEPYSSEMAAASMEFNKVDFMFDVPINQQKILKDSMQYIYEGNMYAIVFNMNEDKIGNSSVFRNAIGEAVKALYIKGDIYSETGFVAPKGKMTYVDRKDWNEAVAASSSADELNLSQINKWFKDSNFDKETEIRILCRDDVKSKFLAQRMSTVFKDEMEINIVPVFADEEAYEKALQNRNFTMALMKFYEDEGKKEFFQRWAKDSRQNFSDYSCIEYEKILQQYISSKSDGNESILLQILGRDKPYVPVCFTSKNYAARNKLSGIELDGNGNIEFDNIGESRN